MATVEALLLGGAALVTAGLFFCLAAELGSLGRRASRRGPGALERVRLTSWPPGHRCPWALGHEGCHWRAGKRGAASADAPLAPRVSLQPHGRGPDGRGHGARGRTGGPRKRATDGRAAGRTAARHGRPGTGKPPRQKADSTLRTSQAVPHPSTIRALRRLTSEVGRDPVYSTRYGRQRLLVIPKVGATSRPAQRSQLTGKRGENA